MDRRTVHLYLQEYGVCGHTEHVYRHTDWVYMYTVYTCTYRNTVPGWHHHDSLVNLCKGGGLWIVFTPKCGPLIGPAACHMIRRRLPIGWRPMSVQGGTNLGGGIFLFSGSAVTRDCRAQSRYYTS